MAAPAATRGRRGYFDPWPGYVDVLSTLLMVVIFVLMVFVIATRPWPDSINRWRSLATC